MAFEVTKHLLVPKHVKVSEKEKKELLELYGLELRSLPRILISDPAIGSLSVKEGDIVKIVRKSMTAGEVVFYRRAVTS